MSFLRMQNRTPPIYCEESRDFQLFCRLYDAVTNNILFDTDTITNILDSRDIRDSFLSLLQTKLGFFTTKSFTDNILRYVLYGFPLMVKNKGSKQSIIYAVNTFLKINKIDSPVTVTYQKTPLELANGYTIPDHSIVVGIRDRLQESVILQEIFRYILPIGITYYFYYYQSFEDMVNLLVNYSAEIIYVSDNINSVLRTNTNGDFMDSFKDKSDEYNRLIGAVDTINLISSKEIAGLGDFIYTNSGNNLLSQGNDLLFLGVHYGDSSFSDFIGGFPENKKVVGKTSVIYNESEYILTSSGENGWKKLTILPSVDELPQSGNNPWDVRYLNLSNGNLVPGYYYYASSQWNVLHFPIYMLTQSNESNTKTVPVILTQPTSQEVLVGGTVTLSVSARYAFTYQWQYQKPNEVIWRDNSASGYNTNTMTFKASNNLNNYKYRCVISNGSGLTTSNTITLTVVEQEG